MNHSNWRKEFLYLSNTETTMEGLQISQLPTKIEQDYEILNMIISTATCKEVWLVALILKGNKISTNMEDKVIAAN